MLRYLEGELEWVLKKRGLYILYFILIKEEKDKKIPNLLILCFPDDLLFELFLGLSFLRRVAAPRFRLGKLFLIYSSFNLLLAL